MSLSSNRVNVMAPEVARRLENRSEGALCHLSSFVSE